MRKATPFIGGRMAEGEITTEYSGPVDAIILIPGACHGKWVYKSLITELKSLPSPLIIAEDLIGVGERAEELTPEVNLTSHVDELVRYLSLPRKKTNINRYETNTENTHHGIGETGS